MDQPDKKQFAKKSYVDLFLRSCLGRFIIIGILTAIVLFVAKATVPSKAKMESEMNDDIIQCIQECQAKFADGSDDLVRNTMSVFTHADSIPDDDTMDTFRKHNRIVYYKHTFYHTAYLFNNVIPDGKRVGVGVFGLVIPSLDFSDFIMRMAPLRKDYNQRIIKNEFSVDGDPEQDPDFGNTYDTYR